MFISGRAFLGWGTQPISSAYGSGLAFFFCGFEPNVKTRPAT